MGLADSFCDWLSDDELYAYQERLGILSQGAEPTESQLKIAREQIQNETPTNPSSRMDAQSGAGMPG